MFYYIFRLNNYLYLKNKNPKCFRIRDFGAEDGTRTHDLLITNQLLYQLSHSSKFTLNCIAYYTNLQALSQENIFVRGLKLSERNH